MTKGSVNIASLTMGQPFCAGVVLRSDHQVLLTLNPDGMPASIAPIAWRVGGVGGGQEAGETVWECARREAQEELGVDVALLHSPVTFFHDYDTGELYPIQVADRVALFLFERMTNPSPDRPYAPDLPTGPYLYFSLFLAQLPEQADPYPGDDVQALLQCPLDRWSMIEAGVTVQELATSGATVMGRPGFDWKRQVWLPTDESMATVIRLLRENPDL